MVNNYKNKGNFVGISWLRVIMKRYKWKGIKKIYKVVELREVKKGRRGEEVRVCRVIRRGEIQIHKRRYFVIYFFEHYFKFS